MDDKSSLLKLKLYLFSSIDAEQRQEKRQLTAKEKKDRSLTGRTTYASGMTIGRNPYVGNIKPDEFSERLGKSKQFLERQYEEEGNGKDPVQIKVDGTERLSTPGNYPGEEHIPENQVSKRNIQASAPEEAKWIDRGIQVLQ